MTLGLDSKHKVPVESDLGCLVGLIFTAVCLIGLSILIWKVS